MEDSKSSLGSASESSQTRPEPFAYNGNAAQPVFERQLPTHDTFGRYQVLERLGEGSTGVVYSAYDPELGRRVAIKLLHTPGDPEAKQRLKREAWALASLSHPNVVTLHDVGTIQRDGEESLFITMALIEGRTLARWLVEEKPSWRQALRMLAQAGQGLAAAHQAGLVHRDFKPENVLITKEGVPIVVDFGLARPFETSDTSSRSSNDLPKSLDLEITQDGTLIGSPVYMAPESLEGVGHAHSDQFSFCVTLYEALYGQRPFAGDRLSDLFDSKIAGEIRPVPAHTEVPAWLHRTLLRGLAPQAEDRWPSMEDLLRAIDKDPGRVKRALSSFAILAVALTSFGWWLSTFWSGTNATGCEEASWESVWNSSRQKSLRKVFEETGEVYALDTWTRVRETLDAYVRDGSEIRSQTCQDHKKGRIREADLHRRMACLADRKDELDALLHIFAQADGQILSQATAATLGLSSPNSCASLPSFHLALVDDPDIETALVPLRRQLASIRAARLAAHYENLDTASLDLVKACRSISFPPMLAEVLLVHGSVLEDLGQFEDAIEYFEEAWRMGLGSQQDSIAASALIQMARIHSDRQTRFDQALLRLGEAEALLQRLPEGERPGLEKKLWNVYSGLHIARSEYEQAEDYLDRILDAQQKAQDHEPPLDMASTLNRLAAVRAQQSRYEESQLALSQAFEIYQKSLGANHPRFATLLNNLGVLSDLRGRPSDSEGFYRQSIELTQKILGTDHPKLVNAHSNIGMVFAKRGAYAKAVEALEESLRIAEQNLGSEHSSTARVQTHLGIVLIKLERFEEAEAILQKALETRKQIFGSEDPNVAHSLMAWGLLQRARGQYEEAIANFRRVLLIESDESVIAQTHLDLGSTLREAGHLGEAEEHLTDSLHLRRRLFGPDHPDIARSLFELGRLHADLEENEEALRLLDIASQLESFQYLAPAERADIHFSLADTVWLCGRSKLEATQLARLALSELEEAEASPHLSPEEINEWLASHQV